MIERSQADGTGANRAEKALIRQRIRAQRSRMSDADRLEVAAGITRQLVSLTTTLAARSVSCFFATATEPETRPFIEWALGRRLTVLLPVLPVLPPASDADGGLSWVAANSLRTTTGRFGIEEPVGNTLPAEAVAETDLMLIPACAVSLDGARLGWGRGYFDRVLAALPRTPPVYAVVHDAELLTTLPVETHDQPVTGVVTETRTIEFSRERADARFDDPRG